MRRFLFVFFAFLLTATSILAPAPDWLAKVGIVGAGGELGGLQTAEASGDILPRTIGQAAVPPIGFKEDRDTYTLYNSQFTFVFSKTESTDQILDFVGRPLVEAAKFQMTTTDVKDEKLTVDIGGTTTYKRQSEREYLVIREFLDKVTGITVILIWDIKSGENTKITIEVQNGDTEFTEVSFNWTNKVLSTTHDSTTSRITFTAEDAKIGFDWDDAAKQEKCSVTSAVSETAKGKESSIGISIGKLAPREKYVIDPSIVGTSNTQYAISKSFQRKTFYAASRFWVWFIENANTASSSFYTSLDGIDWGDGFAFYLTYNASSTSLWYDEVRGYVHLVFSTSMDNNNTYYERGLPCDNGTIMWYTDPATDNYQVAIPATAGEHQEPVFICVDSAGNPVISYQRDDAAVETPYITASSTSNGTWTTRAGFPYQLSTTDDINWRASVLPLSDNDLIAIYARDGQPINSKVYDSSATTWASENATISSIEVSSYFSAVVTSDNVCHMVFLGDTSENITYTHYHSGGTAWQTEEVVYAAASATSAPVLSKTLDGNLYAFWMGDPTADHIYYKAQVSGVWDTSETDWLTEVDITASDRLNCAYEQTSTNYISVIWLVDDGANYNVRFGALEQYDPTGVSITCTPDNVTGTWAYLSGGGSPVQYLRANQWYTTETGITWGALKFTLSNDGTGWSDVLISSDNWTGLGKTWYLSDSATPSASTIGLKAGIVYSTPGYFLVGDNTSHYQVVGFGGSENETQYTGYDFSGTSDYTVLVKRQEPWNYLVTGLCPTCSVWWGFKILLPTSSVGNSLMSGYINLTATLHT